MTQTEILVVIGFGLLFGGPLLYFLNKFLQADEQQVLDQMNQAIWASQMGFEYLGYNWEGRVTHPNELGLGLMGSAKLSEVSCGDIHGVSAYLADYRYSTDSIVTAFHVIVLTLDKKLPFNACIYHGDSKPYLLDSNFDWKKTLLKISVPYISEKNAELILFDGDRSKLEKVVQNLDFKLILSERFFAAVLMEDNFVVQYQYGPCPDYEDGFVEAVNRLKKLAMLFSDQEKLFDDDHIQALKDAEREAGTD